MCLYVKVKSELQVNLLCGICVSVCLYPSLHPTSSNNVLRGMYLLFVCVFYC